VRRRTGKLEVELHEFFDLMLNLVETASQNENETGENGLANVKSGDWWRLVDALWNVRVSDLGHVMFGFLKRTTI